MRYQKVCDINNVDKTAEEASKVVFIDVNSIRPNPYQPRKHFADGSLEELCNSIKEVGLIQPISVVKKGEDNYELVAGERRLRASKLAGLTKIKAIIVSPMVEQDMALIAIIENLQRENLHFFEEAEGYQCLIREHGFTQDELAKKVSKNQSTIANKTRILRLSRQVKDKIVEGNLTERHARALLRLHNEEAQLRLIEKIVAEGLSVKSTEDMVEIELTHLYGEEKDEKACKVVRLKYNYKTYVNTIKKTVSKISASGVNAVFDCVERADYLEVTVKIMK